MSLKTILQKELTTKVWCEPSRDYQYTFKPKRISPAIGYSSSVTIGRDIIKLPTTSHTDRYIIYQIGPIFSDYVNLPDVRNEWLNARGIIGFNNIMIDVFDERGFQCPRHLVWCYMFSNNNIVLAVKRSDKVDWFTEHDLYLKLYSNAYFKSPAALSTDGMECFSEVVTTSSIAQTIQNKHTEWKARTGRVLAYINGILRDSVLFTELVYGDHVDLVWDSSIYQVLDIPFKDTHTFSSVVDNVQKYLIHANKAYATGKIEFYDDYDFYLLRKTDTETKGVYYYRTNSNSVRMVTHRDYSLPVSAVDFIRSKHDLWESSNDIVLRIVYRKSGLDRPLIPEATRIINLYEMEDSDIVDAMVGMDALIPEWQAASLEASAFSTTIAMQNPFRDLTYLQDLFGYHGINNLLGTALLDVEKKNAVEIPVGLRMTGTVYEYGMDRLLSGSYLYQNSTGYGKQKPDTKYLEFIFGKGTDITKDHINESTVIIDPEFEHRVYRIPIVNFKQTGEIIDITSSDRVTLSGSDLAISGIDTATEVIIVRQDKTHLSYSTTMENEDEVISFTINTYGYREGTYGLYPCQVPYAEFDVFLNGYCLIKDVQYEVNWPVVTIYGTDGLVEGTSQRITVRGFGMLDKNNTVIHEPKEKGFIRGGYLSRNSIYNIRNGYVLRYNVGGKLYLQDEIPFGDNVSERVLNPIQNGVPYEVKEYIQPIVGLEGIDPYTYYYDSVDRTNRLESYLTVHIPEPKFPKVESNLFKDILPAFDDLSGIVSNPLNEYVVEFTNPSKAAFSLTKTIPLENTTDGYNKTAMRWASVQVRGIGHAELAVGGASTVKNSNTTEAITTQLVLSTMAWKTLYVPLFYVGSASDHTITLSLNAGPANYIEMRSLQYTISDTLMPFNINGQLVYPDRFTVSSPFLTRIWYELRNGFISDAVVLKAKSDSSIIEIVKHLEYLVPFDPYKNIDFNEYIKVQSFPTTLPRPVTILQDTFLKKVNELYFDKKYPLDNDLTIVSDMAREDK